MDGFIPTRGSKVKQGGSVEGFLSINYETRKKKSATSLNPSTKPVSTSTVSHDKTVKNDDKNVDPKRAQELEMKRARYDVIKFGMSGFQGTKIKEAKVALAVSLGAKPPKNPNINYKKILKQKKGEKFRKAKEKMPASGLKKSLVKYKTKSKKSSGILGIYGKVQKDAMSRNKK